MKKLRQARDELNAWLDEHDETRSKPRGDLADSDAVTETESGEPKLEMNNLSNSPNRAAGNDSTPEDEDDAV
jgi:hypothetical protein